MLNIRYTGQKRIMAVVINTTPTTAQIIPSDVDWNKLTPFANGTMISNAPRTARMMRSKWLIFNVIYKLPLILMRALFGLTACFSDFVTKAAITLDLRFRQSCKLLLLKNIYVPTGQLNPAAPLKFLQVP